MTYTAPAVQFDGTNALKIAALTATDNNFVSFATWVKISAAKWTSAQTLWVCDSENAFTNCVLPASLRTFEFYTADAADANQLNMIGSVGALGDGTWTFLIGTADTTLGIIKMQNQAGDISHTPITNNSPFNMTYNGKSFWFMGDSFGSGDYVTGCASDTSFWPGVSFLDGSGNLDPAKVALFIDSHGYPVDPAVAIAALGTPAILFSGNASSYATNRGSGGAFTLVGDALVDCTSTPGPPSSVSIYTMEARENYDPAVVALLLASTPPLWAYTDTQDSGMQFDFNGRRLIYAVLTPERAPDLMVDPTGGTSVNNTGFSLWDGVRTNTGAPGTVVVNGGDVAIATLWNLTIGFKNIDTDAVSFTSVFGPSNVPTGLGPAAYGYIQFSNNANPTNGENVVINGVTWTFVSGTPSGTQTKIQGSLGATIQQLAWDLNASANGSLTPAYYIYGSQLSLATSAPVYPALFITYKTAGTAGNSFTLDAGTVGGTLSGATLANGAAGSDGTWLRMVGDTDLAGGSVPMLFDPHTQNIWIHMESCEIYLFRFSDNYEQIISPYNPVYNLDNPNYPIGITATWFFCFEQNSFGSPATTPFSNFLHCIPATIQTEETTLDKLLSYADYDYPALLNSAYFRHCMDHSGNFYVIGSQQSGTRNYKFWKFTPPTSAPWGGPVVGGGFTDITPWSSSTGPNTNEAGYTVAGAGQKNQIFDVNILMYLPVTKDFVTISIFQGSNFSPPPADYYAATFFDCTYINVASTPTFDYHHAFVTGYMSAAWTPTSKANAAYAVVMCREHNLYMGMTDYAYNADYTKRWFMFQCGIVLGGTIQGGYHNVLVQYQFVSGASPIVLQVIDEIGWDAAYAAYGLAIADASVVFGSMVNPSSGNTDIYTNDCGLYDPTTNSFWWSGACDTTVGGNDGTMYYLNSYFTPRATMNGGWYGSGPGQAPNPPFLRLTFSSSGGGVVIGPGAYFIERMDNRIWPAVENVWCVDCALQTTLPTYAATLNANSATGAGIPTGVTGLFGGQGYSAGTTADILDPTGTGASVGLTIASGIITGITITGGSGYTYPQLVFTDPAGTGLMASAEVTLDNSATFITSAAVLDPSMVGSIIRMGGGIATITAFISAQKVTANITTPIAQVIPNTGGLPTPQAAGDWSIATPVSTVYGLMHLAGFTVTGVADGAVVTPRVVQPNGSVTLDNPATLITLGLAFTPQFQSLYLDGGSPTVQGQRKKVAAVTVRLDASGVTGILGGSNQPTPSAQSPQVLSVPWTGLDNFETRPDQAVPPYGSTTPPLFTGDVRQPVSGGFDKPGQVAFEQTLPLPMNITAIVPEGLEGDQAEQGYQPKTQREPRGKPKGGGR